MLRPKVVLGILLALAACVGLMISFPRHSSRPGAGPAGPGRTVSTAEPGVAAVASAPNATEQPQNQAAAARQEGESLAVAAGAGPEPSGGVAGQRSPARTAAAAAGHGAPTEDEVEVLVTRKIAQLQDLATQSDPTSMAAILAEMRSPYAEVRSEALEAIVQFRSRDAIPALKELAAQAEETSEKRAILEAVEFLELPTLAEMRADLAADRSQNPPVTRPGKNRAGATPGRRAAPPK